MPSIENDIRVFAVIVTFNGDWGSVGRMVARLVGDHADYVIVDNGSRDGAGLSHLNTIYLGENAGIAIAQNVGIEHALGRGAEVVVFFDQDSEIEAGFVSALVRPIWDGTAKITAPVFYDAKKGFGYTIVKFSRYGFRTRFSPELMAGPVITNVVISSGSAVAAEVFSVVGMMKADLFIDYVDTEWCLRCFERGYTMLVNPSVRMVHSIGDTTMSIGRFKVPVHSPLRRYYRIRNCFLLLRLSHVPKILALRELGFNLAHQILIMLVSRKRFEYLKYGFIAICHGLVNRGGRIS